LFISHETAISDPGEKTIMVFFTKPLLFKPPKFDYSSIIKQGSHE